MPPEPRRARFRESTAFAASLLTFASRHPVLVARLAAFVAAKELRPPQRLPRGMRDHALGGPLEGFRECHLDGDALLIYTDRDDLVTLILVCDHDEPRGGRERAPARRPRAQVL